MKSALIIGGLGILLAVLTPALRGLRVRHSRMSDQEYFAAARKRAISYRLAQAALNERESGTAGNK